MQYRNNQIKKPLKDERQSLLNYTIKYYYLNKSNLKPAVYLAP